MASLNIKKDDTPILLIILFTTFLPSIAVFNILKMLLAVGLLITKMNKGDFNIDKVFVMWALNIVLATAVVAFFEQTIDVNKLIHEFVRIVYYAALVSLCCSLNIDLKRLYICCSVVILIHFTIQLTQYLQLGIFDNFIEKFYLAGDADNIHYAQSQGDDYAFRSGSIFINPNVYVCYPYLSTGVFLQYYKRENSFTSLIMVIVSFLSVVLTGSRMGMISITAIIVIFLLFNRGLLDKKVQILVAALVVILLINHDTVSQMMGELRAFEIGDEAYSGSLSIKLLGLKGYLRNSDPIYWIFGGFGSRYTKVAFDFEYAYIFAWFGIFGVVWYATLIWKIFNSRNRKFPIINNVTVISIMLTAMAATSILSMSVFPYIAVIAFSNISYNKKHDKINKYNDIRLYKR